MEPLYLGPFFFVMWLYGFLLFCFSKALLSFHFGLQKLVWYRKGTANIVTKEVLLHWGGVCSLTSIRPVRWLLRVTELEESRSARSFLQMDPITLTSQLTDPCNYVPHVWCPNSFKKPLSSLAVLYLRDFPSSSVFICFYPALLLWPWHKPLAFALLSPPPFW